jgi:hypothetical protein
LEAKVNDASVAVVLAGGPLRMLVSGAWVSTVKPLPKAPPEVEVTATA